MPKITKKILAFCVFVLGRCLCQGTALVGIPKSPRQTPEFDAAWNLKISMWFWSNESNFLRIFLLFFKMGHPLHLFVFSKHQCKKCPSSIRCWISNSRPLEHQSSPITTRPRLPPELYNFWCFLSEIRFCPIRSHSFYFLCHWG